MDNKPTITPKSPAANPKGGAKKRKRSEALKQKLAAVKGRSSANKKIKLDIQHHKKEKKREADRAAKRKKRETMILLPEDSSALVADEGENTYDYTQQEIAGAVDIRAASKAFDLNLDEFGPYHIDYTRNGKFLVMAGAKGHIATIDWDTKKLLGEFHIKTPIRDVKVLHSHTMIAVAQKRHSYIYDEKGVQLHVLKRHHDVQKLEYLPYHFLLASINAHGILAYQDTSTGELVADFKTGLGFCRVMKQNPQTGIINLGHNNGAVTLWSPTSNVPLVKLQAHRAPVVSIAIGGDNNGSYMLTAGQDSKMHLFDIRTWKSVFSVKRFHVPFSMDISQKNMLAISTGPQVQLWENPFDPESFSLYMQHTVPVGNVQSVKFCPFEDVLGVGHEGGFSSLLVPGSGEPNFDSLEANPMQSRKARADYVVRTLLDKVPYDTIALTANGFGELNTVELTEEEQIKKKHPGFVRLASAGKSNTEAHVHLLEREKRRLASRKVEEEQREQGVAKKKEAVGFKEKPVAPALARFSHKKGGERKK